MKRLWDVLVLTLALNFLAVAGAVGWMYQSGRIDRQRVGTADEAVAALGAARKGGHLVRLATAGGLRYITLGGQ